MITYDEIHKFLTVLDDIESREEQVVFVMEVLERFIDSNLSFEDATRESYDELYEINSEVFEEGDED